MPAAPGVLQNVSKDFWFFPHLLQPPAESFHYRAGQLHADKRRDIDRTEYIRLR